MREKWHCGERKSLEWESYGLTPKAWKADGHALGGLVFQLAGGQSRGQAPSVSRGPVRRRLVRPAPSTVRGFLAQIEVYMAESIQSEAREARLVFLGLALVPVKLLLEIGLCVYGLAEGSHGDFEFRAASRAFTDCRCSAEPFDYPEIAFRHVRQQL
jgi:hypothetical protein